MGFTNICRLRCRPLISITKPALTQSEGNRWLISGEWTVLQIGALAAALDKSRAAVGAVEIDGSGLIALDSSGALTLQHWLGEQAASASFVRWPAKLEILMTTVNKKIRTPSKGSASPSLLDQIGIATLLVWSESHALLEFVGRFAVSMLNSLLHPRLIRWRTVLRNIQMDGLNALPIIGLTAFLLGVVIAYQGAAQLKNYGANIFVVDLVGYSMLREFAPLISAIIIAGRSGSAYAAQIGTMVVTDEVDALRTLAISPLELLVLPKVLALTIVLPLLTVFADIAGVFGGMVMAQTQLDIGFHEFVERFGREMKGATLLLGIGKSFVFAMVIAIVGCFQGFRSAGGADSVGRQTTRSVVQAIFLVIVIDAAFSVLYSLLNL